MHSAVLFVLCAAPVNAVPWVYANTGATSADQAAQTATWGGICVTGTEQSPIDVVTSSAVPTSLPNIDTHFTAAVDFVKNTGHGFQLFQTSPATHDLNASGIFVDATGTPKGYSMIGGEKYNFYQVHWHTPSENTIDGKSFALEAHFVHQLADTALVGTNHRLAVIGLMYELGECNKFLDMFWSQIPTEQGSADYTGAFPDLNQKLTAELAEGYYHWYGSLTTPPCTEGVSWNLLKVHETVCQRQVDKLQEALGNTQSGIRFNNRVPQPLNHRVVTSTGVKATVAAPAATVVPVAEAVVTSTDDGVKTFVILTLVAVSLSVVIFIVGLALVVQKLSTLPKAAPQSAGPEEGAKPAAEVADGAKAHQV